MSAYRYRALDKRGYTLVELIVVIAIISILTSIATMTYGNYRQKSNLDLTVQDAKTMLAEALSRSLSPLDNDPNVNGYGVHFDKSTLPNKIILFANRNASYVYQPTEKIKELVLNRKVNISTFSTVSDGAISGDKLDIVFQLPLSSQAKPYDKITFFNNNGKKVEGIITFSGSAGTKSLHINTLSNLIFIQ